jgi:hypothetical protein
MEQKDRKPDGAVEGNTHLAGNFQALRLSPEAIDWAWQDRLVLITTSQSLG